MKKLSLTLDALQLESIETAPAAGRDGGTVLGMQDASYDPFACSDTCATQSYTCAACDTHDGACTDGDGPDGTRRIIVYSNTS